jgi:hypothetical protein
LLRHLNKTRLKRRIVNLQELLAACIIDGVVSAHIADIPCYVWVAAVEQMLCCGFVLVEFDLWEVLFDDLEDSGD